MLRILLPFAAGILVAEHLEEIPPACFALLALAGAGLWVLSRTRAGALLGEVVLGLGLRSRLTTSCSSSAPTAISTGPTASSS